MQNYLSDCRRCKAFKAKPDVALLTSIHAFQPLDLIHLDYLCLKHSKGKEEKEYQSIFSLFRSEINIWENI